MKFSHHYPDATVKQWRSTSCLDATCKQCSAGIFNPREQLEAFSSFGISSGIDCDQLWFYSWPRTRNAYAIFTNIRLIRALVTSSKGLPKLPSSTPPGMLRTKSMKAVCSNELSFGSPTIRTHRNSSVEETMSQLALMET